MDNLIASDVEILAHRGFSNEYPENTLLAAREASKTADWLEIDVRRCGSGEIVVFHDEMLDHLTDGSGAVCCTDWETLSTFEVVDSGERIPRLAEMFAETPDDVGLMIELKELGMAADILAIAAEYNNQFALSCNVLLALVEARNVDSDVIVGLQLKGAIYSDMTKAMLGVELAGELGFQFVCHGPEYCLDPSFVDAAHERMLAVRSSVPDGRLTEELYEHLHTIGVDHVVIDSMPDFLNPDLSR